MAIHNCAILCALCFVSVHCELPLIGLGCHIMVTCVVALNQTLIYHLMISYSKPLVCTVMYLAGIESPLVVCSIAIARM